MSSSSSPQASSTFWLIDTTSVSDTFTTTATFTLWVPLYTTSTTTSHTPNPSEPSNVAAAKASNRTGIIIGSVVGSLLAISVALGCFWLLKKQRTRPRFLLRAHNSREPKGPDTPQSGSAHALLDLAAEPEPHPENIEPWVEPVAARPPAKLRSEHQRSQAQTPPAPLGDSSRREPSAPAISSTPTGSALQHVPPAPAPTRTLQLAAPDTPLVGSHTDSQLKSTAGPSQSRRRRNRIDPSPPRLEQDAGVSLMRAGEGTTELVDEPLPPAYDLAHAHQL